MKILYECFIIFILLPLAACSPAIAATTQPTSTPQSTETVVPPPTPTFTPAVLTVDQKVDAYLRGEIDNVGDLSSQELAKFSAKLAEEKNEARGINPIIYKNEKYIDPSDYKLKDYDGHPDMNETIQMYVPIAGKDEQGNLQFMVNGQLVTIAGSAGVDWNMVISDPNDTRIDWPKTEPIKETGIPEAQSTVRDFNVVLSPMILLDKQMGEFHLDGIGTHAARDESTLRFYDIETDSIGNPVLARMILTIGLNYNLFEEGGTLDTQSFTGPISETSYFYQGLVENTVYHVGISRNFDNNYEKIGLSVDAYSGIVDYNQVPEVIETPGTNTKDMVLARVSLLIIKNTK